MISYLERLKTKIQGKSLGDEPAKPAKGAYAGFDGSQGRHISQTYEPARYPLGYTEAEIEAARRDAERLGYGRGRIVH